MIHNFDCYVSSVVTQFQNCFELLDLAVHLKSVVRDCYLLMIVFT